jgi:hypothetical protein
MFGDRPGCFGSRAREGRAVSRGVGVTPAYARYRPSIRAADDRYIQELAP